MKKKLILLLSLMLTAHCNALCSVQSYTLPQILNIGLEQNFGIKLIKIDKQIAENNITLGNAGYLPSVDLSLSHNENFTNTSQKIRDDIEESINGALSPQSNIGLNLNYTLFDGFKIQNNYSRFKELNEISALRTKLEIENYIAKLSSEYYNLAQQHSRLRNLSSALELSRERLRIVEQRYNIGLASRLDLSQARADFNADSSQLLHQELNVQHACVNLNNLISSDSLENEIICLDSITLREQTLDEDHLLNSVFDNNTSLKLLERNNELTNLEIDAIKSYNYPIIKLQAGYNFNRYDYNKGTYEWQNVSGLNAGISLDYNLFNGLNTQRELENAKLKQTASDIEIEQLRKNLHSNFINILHSYKNNIELLALERENLEVSKEYYEAAIERYKIGELSGIELRESQLTLLEAEERLLVAAYNSKLAEISIMQICGYIEDYME